MLLSRTVAIQSTLTTMTTTMTIDLTRRTVLASTSKGPTMSGEAAVHRPRRVDQNLAIRTVA